MRGFHDLAILVTTLVALTLWGGGGSGGSDSNGSLAAFGRQGRDPRGGGSTGGPGSGNIRPGTGQPVPFNLGETPTPAVFQEYLVVLNVEEAIVFELDAVSGALTEVSREDFGTGSLPFSVDARADGMVYITFTLASQIGHFQVDALTGSLDLRTTIAQALPEGGAVSPGPNGVFYAFGIDTSTGALTQIGAPVSVTASRAFGFATSPDGNTLFVSGNDNEVDAFAIDQSNGDLSPLAPTFVAQDAQLGEMVVDAVKEVFYVCGYISGQVEAYQLDTAGRPGTAIAGSPFPTSTTGSLTTLINSSGDFLLTTNVGVSPDEGTVSCFRIQPDGSLSPVPGSPFAAGIGTFDMALVRLQR